MHSGTIRYYGVWGSLRPGFRVKRLGLEVMKVVWYLDIFLHARTNIPQHLLLTSRLFCMFFSSGSQVSEQVLHELGQKATSP